MLSFKQFKNTKSSDFQHLLEHFVEYCADQLGLDELPKITIVKDGSIGTAFGCYCEGEIKLNILNRHPMDVLRTTAHEMVHYRQDLHDELHERSGETGSDHENEANSMAGVLMRNFGKENPDLFSFGAILESLNEYKIDDDNGGWDGGEWKQPTVLRHEQTGKRVKEGDILQTRDGPKAIHSIHPPKHSGSSGHVCFSPFGSLYYAHNYGLKFYHI